MESLSPPPHPLLSRSPSPIPPTHTDTPKDFVTKVLSPRVAVVSSPDADEVCRANNFPTFLDMIRPFGELISGKVTARDSQGLPNPIERFTIRFADLAYLEQPDITLASRLLEEKAKAFRGNLNSQPVYPNIRSKSDIGSDYLDSKLDDITPWYAEYRRLFFQVTGVSEHETFDHPVACIIAISSSNPDPIATLSEIYNNMTSAPVFSESYLDPDILKYYVLLHDEHRVSLEHSETIFKKLKQTFGLHCHLLKLNSLPPPSPIDLLDSTNTPSPTPTYPRIPDVWSPIISEISTIMSILQSSTSTPSSPFEERPSASSPILQTFGLPLSPTSTLNSPSSEEFFALGKEKESGVDSQNWLGLGMVGSLPPSNVQYGLCLSEDDFAGIKTFVRELVAQSIIPYMERSIQRWNEQVASSRRGFTGRLFTVGRRYFGGGTKAASQVQQTTQAAHRTNNIYPHTSPEAQMRKLADYAFMLRDYQFARSVYDSVKRDFSADKAWKYYAGAQEMIGLCLLIAPSYADSKIDIDHYFEQAVNAFSNRAKVPFWATKTTILYYEMLKHRNMYKNAPPALIRMAGDDSDLRSALFLEQAAHSFLRYSRPRVRNFAFHMIMAGHRYGKCSQREHACRCYLAASNVFEGHSWSLVEDHIHFALGRQFYHLRDLDNALKFFLKLLRESRQSPSQQQAYLREFLIVYKVYENKTDKDSVTGIQELPVPKIDDNSVRVVLSNSQSSEFDETWEMMEQEFIDEGFKGLDSHGKPRVRPKLSSKDMCRTLCAVGETFFVHLTLYNPMQIPITVNDLVLECEYSANSESAANDKADSTIFQCNLSEDMHINYVKLDAFDLEKLSEVALGGLERKTISLRVFPKKEGRLKVLGLRYALQSIVSSYKKFSKHGKRLNDTKEERMNVVYATDRSLELTVTAPMPLLEVAFRSFPDMLLSGEVTRLVLDISNKGQTGLTDLRVKLSHPSFICIGDTRMLDRNVYRDDPMEFSETQLRSESFAISNTLSNSSIMDVPLPHDETTKSALLAPGKATSIPLWIRGDKIGKHTLRFLFTYESEDKKAAMRYRSLRFATTAQVLQSLKISAFTRPSTKYLNEYILGIEIENLQTTADFQLVQLTSTSPSWVISPVTQALDNSTAIIAPRQTTFTYYRLRKVTTVPPSDGKTPEQYTSSAFKRLIMGENEQIDEPSPVELLVTNIPFSDRIIPSSSKPLESFSINSRIQWKTNTLQNQFPTIPQKQHSQIFTLYTTDDVDLALYWNMLNLPRKGHHYIIGINLGVQQSPVQGKDILIAPSKALYEQTVKERTALINSLLKNKHFKDENPLKLTVACNDVYEYEFSDVGLCTIPITISIRNCSWNKPIRFKMELLSYDQSNTPHKSYMTVFQWTGATIRYGSLAPDEERTITVMACFTQPGVYDLNRWRLTVNTDDDSHTPSDFQHKEGIKGFIQMPSAPHLITIVNKAKMRM